MRLVFADTFYFIALLDSRDSAHAKAIYYSRLPGHCFLTTEYVLLELGDAFHKPALRIEFLALWELLHRDPLFRVVTAHKRLTEKGLQLFKKRPDKEWQLTDCISFVVMKEYAIRDALTSDQHFEQAGFTTLLK